MKIINGWKSKVKQTDKFNIEIRISALTILKLYVDISDKNVSIMIFNFGISLK